MNKYYQQGGEMEQLMQLFQAFADTVQDDEFSTAEEVMQMFQQLSPQEQQQFVQQAIQIVQQEQGEAPQEEQMELEEEPIMQLGGYVNNTGYLEGYETAKNPYNIIKSNRITMNGVDPKIKYIKGTDNLGNTQYMEHGGEYEFDGDFVLEEPIYKQAGGSNDLTQQLQQLEVLLNQKNKEKQIQLQKLNQQKQTVENQRKINEVDNLYNQELKKINDLKQKVTSSLPNVLAHPEHYNLDSKIKEFKNTLNYVNKKVKNLDRLNPDNFDVVGKDQQRVYIKPKKDSGITFKGLSPANIPNEIEFSEITVPKKQIVKPLTQYEIDKQTNFVPQKSTSLKQDKPKSTLPSKKLNKKVAEQVATPEVLPPPVPTEIPEDNFDYRKPLIIDDRFDNYSFSPEEREVNLNPNAFNRTNIGVGKHFFKQYGGATQTNFKSRFNPNADINIGAETEQQFYQPYTNKMRLYPNVQLDPVAGQYDSLPMGANSLNYQAPNAESRSMFEGKGSNQLLDLKNYAGRFGEDNFTDTQSLSNQTVDRKSKFQSFMDKYGKKSNLEFNPNSNQVAPYYNLMKASEPLAGQYRANVDLKYAETPLLDPLPVIQQIQNQQRLATQNINTNSPTGQSYLSNLTTQTQQKTMEVLNDIQQKNQQIAAQNEQARINAYNQEMQFNIATNQQYLQNQMQAQAAKDLAMGEALSTVDQMQANKVRERNAFNSLAATTPGLKKSTNLRNLVTGNQGFDVDPEYQKLQYYTSQYKTPQQLEAESKAKKQVGGSINQFLKRK